MKTLTLRIYLTVVAVLLLFAAASGWLFHQQIETERSRAESVLSERMAAWGDLIQRSLPGDEAPPDQQSAALLDWSQRLRLPLALDDAKGKRIAVSDSFAERLRQGPADGLDHTGAMPGRGGDGRDRNRAYAVQLEDGRTLWVMRPGRRIGPGMGPQPGDPRGAIGPPPMVPPLFPLSFVPPPWQGGAGLVILLGLLFVAVSLGAWPVVNHLTRRLQSLRQGVEQFGAGELSHRVDATGSDEVAAVAASFNQAASRIEALVRSHQSLLANASHELRSPLARMRMAVSMLDDAPTQQRDRLKREIDLNVAELDALVEEVLLVSRLDALRDIERRDGIDLLGLVAEEAAHVGARVDGRAASVSGDERLLRRAVRNLIENAQRYGGGEVEIALTADAQGVAVQVCDRGPGVPDDLRERIFEPFYRLPGHAETAGGVGLGLSLVKQIAERHGGRVRCEPREGGGSCFVLSLPRAAG
ncbi:MAG: HAMP domain-containing sensor histidine kinase [Burkholderiaceae bacterium]|nr:HAMP domain-containing sensor histidine kinase [Burkholderiaceae bacterium]